MDLLTSSPLFIAITLLSTYLVSFAYKNTKFILKHKVKLPQSIINYHNLNDSYYTDCSEERGSHQQRNLQADG